MKKIISLALSLILVLSFAAGCNSVKDKVNSIGGQITGEQTNTEQKNITVTVKLKDGTSTEHKIATDEEFLLKAMQTEGLIPETVVDGYVTTICDITADYSVDKSWWCLTKNGQMTTTGFGDTPLTDGDSFEVTYTIG